MSHWSIGRWYQCVFRPFIRGQLFSYTQQLHSISVNHSPTLPLPLPLTLPLHKSAERTKLPFLHTTEAGIPAEGRCSKTESVPRRRFGSQPSDVHGLLDQITSRSTHSKPRPPTLICHCNSEKVCCLLLFAELVVAMEKTAELLRFPEKDNSF